MYGKCIQQQQLLPITHNNYNTSSKITATSIDHEITDTHNSLSLCTLVSFVSVYQCARLDVGAAAVVAVVVAAVTVVVAIAAVVVAVVDVGAAAAAAAHLSPHT